MKIIVRCKATGVYFQRTLVGHNPFTTLDKAKATRLDDTPEVRASFTRNFPFSLEFLRA
jgi:predicted nuclease of restriction endonuclease-like (RecB) superfamily